MGRFVVNDTKTGAVMHPRRASIVLLISSCVAAGGLVTAICVRLGDGYGFSRAGSAILALLTVWLIYFVSSLFFKPLMGWCVLLFPRGIIGIFFREAEHPSDAQATE